MLTLTDTLTVYQRGWMIDSQLVICALIGSGSISKGMDD